MKFLLDANFLMIPGKFGVDVFSELEKFGKPELYTLDLVVKELESISSSRGKDARYARLGLAFIEKKGIRTIPSEGSDTDREIGRVSMKDGLAVCTQDARLRKSLHESGVRVITLRQGKYLVGLR